MLKKITKYFKIKEKLRIIKRYLTILCESHFLKYGCTILFYHVIGNEASENSLESQLQLHTVSLINFEKQLSILKKNTKIVSMLELDKRIRSGKSVRGLSAITFDDGSSSFFSKALPVIEKFDIPVTLYVTTDLLEGGDFWRDRVRVIIKHKIEREFIDYAKKYNGSFSCLSADEFYVSTKLPEVEQEALDMLMRDFLKQKKLKPQSGLYATKEQIQECKYNKLFVGSHSHKHYMLSSLSPIAQLNDLKKAKNKLLSWGIDDSGLFSMPFGDSKTYTEETLSILKSLGYTNVALTAENGKWKKKLFCKENQIHIFRKMAINQAVVL